jgi:hypothetical protein
METNPGISVHQHTVASQRRNKFDLGDDFINEIELPFIERQSPVFWMRNKIPVIGGGAATIAWIMCCGFLMIKSNSKY